MQKPMKRVCSICKSNKKRIIGYQHFYPLSKQNFDYKVVVCQNCGFLYADTLLSKSGYEKYYKNMSKYEGHIGEGQVSAELNNSHKRIYKLLNSYSLQKNIRILDIGCSTGNLLNNFKINGYKSLFGIEPAPKCKTFAKRLYDIDIKTIDLDSYRAERKFDVILLSHVLEHILDIKKAIKIIKKISRINTLIYIEVPAAHKFDEALGEPFGQFSIEHLNFFSEISLRNLMGLNGFEKVYLKTQMNKMSYYPSHPVITSIWRRTRFVLNNFKRDKGILKNITTYMSLSKKLNKKVEDRISKIIASNTSFILWGAGVHTLRLLSTTNLSKAKIKTIVDNNKNLWGRTINGFKIRSPKEIINSSDPILISSYVYQSEIASWIKSNIKACKRIINLY